jgi:hypothetical protein
LEIAVVLKAKLEAGNIQTSQITQLIQCLTKLGMVPAKKLGELGHDPQVVACGDRRIVAALEFLQHYLS